MTDATEEDNPVRPESRVSQGALPNDQHMRQRVLKAVIWTLPAVLLALFCCLWLNAKASAISTELQAAVELVPRLKENVSNGDASRAAETVQKLTVHTSSAREATEDPMWKIAGALPWLGRNFQAVTVVATSADEVARFSATPLSGVLQSLDWDSLTPDADGIDLAALQAARPTLVKAAHAVMQSADRLDQVDTEGLLPQISEPLIQARLQLKSLQKGLNSAADVASLAPNMLGAQGPRNYLLMIQNNAEARASGGIPGALAVLTLENGSLSLGAQSSTAEFSTAIPVVPVDEQQQHIYSARLGKYIQDVNLTPDYPTAAATAQAMWERKTSQRVDGVISVDPVALSYIIQATGPIDMTSPESPNLASLNLPKELSSQNVVQTLLSEVYAEIELPERQDAYFAGVAQNIFASLSSGKTNARMLMTGLTQAVEEGRILLWSSDTEEQSVITNYTISGSIAGPSVRPSEFGVYFNDGTGAKMDYYVKRTVQLIKECPKDGYEQTTVRVTSANTAPADAATSLPPYVTGDGIFGVPPGTVQTNIVVYGPVQAQVETAKLDGQKTEFAPYFHGNRPVGVLAIRLAPGESKTVDFTFGKIVQHTEPNVVVTPSVQDVKDVTLPTETAACG